MSSAASRLIQALRSALSRVKPAAEPPPPPPLVPKESASIKPKEQQLQSTATADGKRGDDTNSEPVVISFPPLDPMVVTTHKQLAPDPAVIPKNQDSSAAATTTLEQAPVAEQQSVADKPAVDKPLAEQPTVDKPLAEQHVTSAVAEPVTAATTPKVSLEPFTIPTPVKIKQVIKPHIPLIKFRKGGMPGTLASPAAAPVSTPAPAAAAVAADIPLAAAAATSAAFKTTQMPVREWWDTPSRFKRRQVDTSECDLINGGGCDKLYQ